MMGATLNLAYLREVRLGWIKIELLYLGVQILHFLHSTRRLVVSSQILNQ